MTQRTGRPGNFRSPFQRTAEDADDRLRATAVNSRTLTSMALLGLARLCLALATRAEAGR